MTSFTMMTRCQKLSDITRQRRPLWTDDR